MRAERLLESAPMSTPDLDRAAVLGAPRRFPADLGRGAARRVRSRRGMVGDRVDHGAIDDRVARRHLCGRSAGVAHRRRSMAGRAAGGGLRWPADDAAPVRAIRVPAMGPDTDGLGRDRCRRGRLGDPPTRPPSVLADLSAVLRGDRARPSRGAGAGARGAARAARRPGGADQAVRCSAIPRRASVDGGHRRCVCSADHRPVPPVGKVLRRAATDRGDACPPEPG